MNWHIAETREQARAEALQGLHRWHNEYNVGTLMRPGLPALDSTADAIEFYAEADDAAGVIGTPDELIARIHKMYEVTGGFGVVMGFVNDWANPEATRRSWDLVARHVIPEVNGAITPMRASNTFVRENREYFDRAGKAILNKIMDNDRAKAAFEESGVGAAPLAHNSPGESNGG